MLSHTETLLHTNTFTQSFFYFEQLYIHMPKQTEVRLQRTALTQGAFTYGGFYTDVLLHDSRWQTRIWSKEFSKHATSQFHPQLLTIETHFVGEG